MKNMKDLADELQLNSQLSSEDIPDLNLYMDQVIQLFEQKFSGMKRNTDEKVLTKTMINNYAKGELFFPVENKKYSKEHLILISMIYQMKGTLSISDVKTTLARLNEKVTDDDAFNLPELYQCYLQLMAKNAEKFEADLQEHHQDITETIRQLADNDEAYLEQIMMIAVFTNMSNHYRRAAEKLVDELGSDQ
ncbi:DUF1836 domain-containing protein [Lentibacillus sp. CBA3610]|uniref:DUF1836 domain-containing protein n=1 Tax=Lentibacillus sp. CBA3610 TaxID=2518176 RepID=UPI00159543A6|nr:DUF1836 domain-containing protein [Lentibacillus sp. CBA3610]QKY69848.1 DUF1836 domain-containing protein [Lentibacillus sp. CBA3610]